MALFDSTGARRHSWTGFTENGPDRLDGKPQNFRWTDATLMAGLGAAALAPAMARRGARPGPIRAGAAGQSRQPRPPAGRPGHAGLVAARARTALQARRDPRFAFGNELPAPLSLNWRGIDGVPAAEPLTGRPPLARRGQGNPAIAVAPRRDLPVRPQPARRRPTAPSQARALIVEGKRGRRRRSRRGAADRGLAAAAGWNRDRARTRSRRRRANPYD